MTHPIPCRPQVFALDLTNTAVADISGLGKVSELGLGRCFKIKKFEVCTQKPSGTY